VDLKTADAGFRAAGRADLVATSLPTRADVLVNCVPANCIPSPESPQKRTVASSIGMLGFGMAEALGSSATVDS